MKMNRKVIGISVASLGILFSIGGAVALYTQAADNASFGISAGHYQGSEGAITYKINGNTSGTIAPSYNVQGTSINHGEGLGGQNGENRYTEIEYSMPLSATFADGLNAQTYVAGNISVSITDIPAAYQGKLAIWVDIDGYVAGSYGEANYNHVFMNSDYAITSENQSFVANHDVTVAASGTQTLRVFMKFDLAGIDMLAQDEAALEYSLNVVWGAPSEGYIPAYVVGNGNQWAKNDDFAMTRNINRATAEGEEWMYTNLPGTLGEAKCIIGDTWSTGGNAVLNSESTYTVYWNGSGDASFSAN